MLCGDGCIVAMATNDINSGLRRGTGLAWPVKHSNAVGRRKDPTDPAIYERVEATERCAMLAGIRAECKDPDTGKNTYRLLSIPLEALLGPSRGNWDVGRPVYRLDRPRWCVVKCCTPCNLVPLPK